jgi:hypothetical protein
MSGIIGIYVSALLSRSLEGKVMKIWDRFPMNLDTMLVLYNATSKESAESRYKP